MGRQIVGSQNVGTLVGCQMVSSPKGLPDYIQNPWVDFVGAHAIGSQNVGSQIVGYQILGSLVSFGAIS